MPFDVKELRSHFPELETKVNGHSLVYFDNGASSLKPEAVAKTIYNYYLYETANIHRGAHTLSRQGTEKFEATRVKVQNLIHAKSASEVIFTRGVTESINLLSHTISLSPNDVILLSPFEHHSNIIPWKMACEKSGARIVLMPISLEGHVDVEQLIKLFKENSVKIVSMLLYSNVTGVRLEAEKVIEVAKKYNAVTIIDAAQAMLHETLDVQKMGCDFLTFSGHKMLAPYGVGVLYGRLERLQELPPFMGGGSMISKVTWEKTIYQEPPHKFEAGTPSIADVIGLGAAIDFINRYQISEWNDHGSQLTRFIESELQQMNKVKVIAGHKEHQKKCDIISFTYDGAHPSDVGEILDQLGVAVRAGHLCAQPMMDYLGIPGTVRVSLAPYNTREDAESFLSAMKKVGNVL